MGKRVVNWQAVKESGQLACSCCQVVLPLSSFYTRADVFYTTCIECQESSRLKRLENIDNKIKYICRKAKSRSADKGYEFDLTPEFLLGLYEKQRGLCYFSGMKLEAVGENAVSLDRLDSSKGYTKDNICLCCLSINIFKTDLPLDKFLSFCKMVANNSNA